MDLWQTYYMYNIAIYLYVFSACLLRIFSEGGNRKYMFILELEGIFSVCYKCQPTEIAPGWNRTNLVR